MGLLALAAAIAYTVALVLVLVASQQDERRPADAIVVLGAAQYNGRPSPVLRARLDHALGLYREGLAPRDRGDRRRRPGRHHQRGDGRPALPHRPTTCPTEAVIAQPVGRSTTASMNAVAAVAARAEDSAGSSW